MDSPDDSRASGPPRRARPRTWPIAGGIAITALAGVLTPYLARAEGREAAAHGADRRPRADTVAAPDPGATDEPNANGGAPSAPDPTNSPAVGFVQLLPDVAIKCVADRRRHGSDVRNARLLCAEVRPRVRGRHRGRPIFDGFWG